ncbi:deoxyribose-phosphate aldolase [Aerococcaceae bacterium WGS1372]
MELEKYIDHTLLKADATKDQIEKLCQEAAEYNFKSVCINPAYVKLASELLNDSDSLVCTVIGFPLGANTTEVKVFEAQQAIKDGADEIDMVINISKAKDGDWDYVLNDIQQVVQAAGVDITTKVIIETALLTKDEITKVSQIVKESGADFVKTSTGFCTGGATVEDVKLMRKAVGPEFDIKASGGVSNYDEAIEMIEAGATRIGASKGIAIVTGKLTGNSDDSY